MVYFSPAQSVSYPALPAFEEEWASALHHLVETCRQQREGYHCLIHYRGRRNTCVPLKRSSIDQVTGDDGVDALDPEQAKCPAISVSSDP